MRQTFPVAETPVKKRKCLFPYCFGLFFAVFAFFGCFTPLRSPKDSKVELINVTFTVDSDVNITLRPALVVFNRVFCNSDKPFIAII